MVHLNLCDDQWEWIQHLLLGKASDRGRSGHDSTRTVHPGSGSAQVIGRSRGGLIPKLHAHHQMGLGIRFGVCSVPTTPPM